MLAMSQEQLGYDPAEFLKGVRELPGKPTQRGKWALLPCVNRKLGNQDLGGEPHPGKQVLRTLQRRATVLGWAFVMLCVLVAIDATQPVDRWVQIRAHAFASYPLDVVTSLITTLGGAEITGVITLLLSFIWWQRKGIRGLTPLLLFVGVAIEIVLKYFLPHPGPPVGLARGFHYLSFFHFPTPFSFPSGHTLRTAFLVALIAGRMPRWRVAGWLLVAAVALTRLYLNVHSISDVVGGILLGLTLAAVAAVIDARSSPPQRR